MEISRRGRVTLLYIIAGIALLYWLRSSMVERREEIPYTTFKQQLGKGNVEQVQVGQDEVQGTYKQPVGGQKSFQSVRIEDRDLLKDLEKQGVKAVGVAGGGGISTFLLSWILPIVLMVGVWMFIMRRMGSAQASVLLIGKSRTKVIGENDVGVTFEDVAGVEEAKDELKEIVRFLREPGPYTSIGARIPKGVLLVGPPGTGKTLLARAVAGEAKVPFFLMSGAGFVEMFVGVGAARIRDLFEQAKTKRHASSSSTSSTRSARHAAWE